MEKHAGGPLKRQGYLAEEWNVAIGPSLDALPGTQLPLVRTILQRYRALRIANETEKTENLVKIITEEAKVIWDKARIPTTSLNNCHVRVRDAIDIWRSCHNPGEMVNNVDFQKRLNSLLDLKPKLRGKPSQEAELENLRRVMREKSESKRKEGDKYNWETDYDFYVDQFCVSFKLLFIFTFHT